MRKQIAAIDARLAALGGDDRERAREIDLLRFQVDELVAAGLTSADEDDELRAESEILADASGHREAAGAAVDALSEEGGAKDALAMALAAMGDRSPFAEIVGRLHGVAAELDDVAGEIRVMGERIDSDPERLAVIGERRRVLQDLRRKYGESIAEVIAWRDSAVGRLEELEGRDEIAAALDAERQAALTDLARLEAEVLAARTAAAPKLAAAVQSQLPDLALAKARVEIEVDGIAGRDVSFRFAANPGMPLQPLAKVASGGELARAMLALRLVLTEGPPLLVFDEVDAGIGGAAAVAVGRSLASIGTDHQVLVVTHLAQVAAWAHAHIVVDKSVIDGLTITTVAAVDDEDRITELARMLSGTPGSATARDHARELLSDARH
jgi:DNA repair protein RecN (Recombination protein N)